MALAHQGAGTGVCGVEVQLGVAAEAELPEVAVGFDDGLALTGDGQQREGNRVAAVIVLIGIPYVVDIKLFYSCFVSRRCGGSGCRTPLRSGRVVSGFQVTAGVQPARSGRPQAVEVDQFGDQLAGQHRGHQVVLGMNQHQRHRDLAPSP